MSYEEEELMHSGFHMVDEDGDTDADLDEDDLEDEEEDGFGKMDEEEEAY